MVEKVDTRVFVPQFIVGITDILVESAYRFYLWSMETDKYGLINGQPSSFGVAESIAKRGGIIDSQIDRTIGI